MLKKISKAAGVSLSTASRILNKSNNSSLKTKRTVLQEARKARYFEQAFNHCHCIDNIVIFINKVQLHKHNMNKADYPNSNFFSDFYNGILTGTTERCHSLSIKYQIHYYEPHIFKEIVYSHFISDESVDAAVFIAVEESELSGIASYLSNDKEIKPFIFINSQFTSQHLHNITPENYAIGLEAAEYLYNQGHHNILHLAIDHRLTLQRRTEGFRHFCETHISHFSPKENIIYINNFTHEETEQKLDNYLATHPLPDAIFACTDTIALLVIRYFYQRNMLIPQHISLISVDNQYFCELVTPKLTSIAIPNYELGVEAINELCYQSIFPPIKGKRITLPGTLVERESVRKKNP